MKTYPNITWYHIAYIRLFFKIWVSHYTPIFTHTRAHTRSLATIRTHTHTIHRLRTHTRIVCISIINY